MDHNFWHQKWETNAIGFHEKQTNPLLEENFKRLSLKQNSRVFIPLCGKTVDIAWLLSHGYRVAGVELVESAIIELFETLQTSPAITSFGDMKHYSANNIDIFVGDIFTLTSDMLGEIDAVYDRAALVALPAEMRTNYTAHLVTLTKRTPQLLITYVYDQTTTAGPPFSVGTDEVLDHYDKHYNTTLEVRKPVPGGMKGTCPAEEHVWLLH